MVYESTITTLPRKDQWKSANDDEIISVLNILWPRGSPKKWRMKSILEGKNSRTKSVHKCGWSYFWGFYRSTCKNLIGQNSDQTPLIKESIRSSNNINSTIGV